MEGQIKIVDSEGYYSEQFLCRQVPTQPQLRGQEEILDMMFLAVNLVADLAPNTLKSPILDVSTEVSGMPMQLKLRGFEQVVALPTDKQHREAIGKEFKAEGWDGDIVDTLQSALPKGVNLDTKPEVVTFMDSSFGQYTNRASQLGALKAVAKVMAKEGVLILDLSNPIERIRNVSMVPTWTEGDGAWVLNKETIDPMTMEYVTTQVTVSKKSGEASEVSERGLLITLPNMRDLLNEVGLTIHKVHGNYERDGYEATSTRMIVIAGKG